MELAAVWVLAFWWAAWTLADFYLIPFTPWSELLVLLVCGVTAWLKRVSLMDTLRGHVERGLDSVTQTHVRASKENAYDRQVEETV